MITLEELQAEYPTKEIIFKSDAVCYPNDIVTLDDGREIRLDANIHVTFLKEEVAGEYFNMTLLHRIGELYPFRDEAIRTVVIAVAPAEEGSTLEGFLRVTEGNKATTFTFLAGGK